MTTEQFKVLEGYYPQIYKMVINQACMMPLTMKSELLEILRSEGETGICGKCNSGLLQIAEKSARLYVKNKDKFNREEYGQTKDGRTQNARKGKRIQ